MIIWLNGAFGAGKTTAAYELHRRLAGSLVYDPEEVGYFLRRSAPCFRTPDFQDLPLWRALNYEPVSYTHLCSEFSHSKGSKRKIRFFRGP